MQEFVFTDNNENEADIITNVLYQENILFKTRQRKVPVYCDCEDDEPCDYMDIYDISCFTDLEHYDFVKSITDKKIERIRTLNKVFFTKNGKRSKKVIARMEKTLNNANRNIHNKK